MILAIEAAVRGGSIALIDGEGEITSWHGTEAVSRSEELLWNIADLLARTKVDRSDLDVVAASNGPGSYTGIRIGIATSLGLAKALNIECVGVPLLAAVAKMHSAGPNCVVAIPIGRSEVCWEVFGEYAGSTGTPLTGLPQDLNQFAMRLTDTDILLQHDAYEAMASLPDFSCYKERAYDCGLDLATAIGLASGRLGSGADPNYIRNSRFSSNPL